MCGDGFLSAIGLIRNRVSTVIIRLIRMFDEKLLTRTH